MSKLASCVLSLLLLSGCATSPDQYQPSTLKEHVVITADALYEEKRGAFNSIWTVGLHPGTYTPELEGEGGVFFRGPPRCVVHQPGAKTGATNATTGVWANREGGIWIPSDRTQSPRVYFYEDFDFDNAYDGGGAVVAGMLAFEKGKITRLPPSPDPAFLAVVVPRASE